MPAAFAAPGDQNPGVVVSEIKLTDAAGAPLTEQLTVGDTFLINGSWDAQNADPQPGETFTIGLPDEFKFVLGGPEIALKGTDPVTGAAETWATCVPANDTGDLTCTFADIVAERTLIHGEFTFEVEAAGPTDLKEVEFDLNGTPGIVELPGDGGIDDGIDLPSEVSKSGAMNKDNWSMTWTIDIPGGSLVAAGGDVAHITDTLGSGHVLCDPIGLTVQTVRGDTVVDVSDLAAITSGAPGDSSFAFDLTKPGSGFDKDVTYRVKYQTCTADGTIDPENTVYTNSAEIEGWGDAGKGIGTVTNRPWHQSVSKTGSVLGGADRNGKIAWTVTIPGSEIKDTSSFTFADTLGAGHQLTADTISGLRVHQQYGPSGTLNSDITNKLVQSEKSSTNDSFGMTFTLNDGTKFQDSDWRYIITYVTQLTSTDLPEGGALYSNAASVNGKVTAGEATVPKRKYEKVGKLNDKSKTLDGVEHAAFTTLDWSVTIPGEKLDGMGILDLTDVLGDTHTVCAAGDPTQGLAAQLGLSVRVSDQIKDGGKTPAQTDLTDVTTVTQNGQTVTFKTDLPGDEKFSRDYQYVVSYTTCTASGGMDARGTEYTNSIKGSGIDRQGVTSMNYSGSGTGTGVAKGSVGVAKKISGQGAALVANNTEFSVLVEEFAPGATSPEATYELKVPLNGAAVNGKFPRGNGWTMRISEPTFPAVPGVVFGSPKFTAAPGVTVNADGTVATAAITPQTNIAVELTNTAELGQMTVTKKVEGPAAGLVHADRQYGFTAAIDVSALSGVAAQADREFTLGANETETLQGLPIGAKVTITETPLVDDALLTWGTPVVSPNPVTIAAANVAAPAAVTVTNSVARSVGSFWLMKTVEGDQQDNPAVPSEVTVTATWQQEGEVTPTSKTLTLPVNGGAVSLGERLLVGTKVTLTETPLVDGSSIAWSAPAWYGNGVAQGENNTAVVTIGLDEPGEEPALVNLVNHAATSTAGISLMKMVSGEAAADVPADAEFPVTASWTDAAGDEQSVALMINTKTPTPIGVDLPAGTEITFTEGDRPSIDTVVWGSIGISGEAVTDNSDGSASIVVSSQQNAVTLVTVTNEATWAAGTFSLAKQVEGVALNDADVPDAVEVTATWLSQEGEAPAEQSKTILVPTDGSKIEFGEQLPAFTSVTLAETALDATDRFAWATPAWGEDESLVVNPDGTATLTIQPAGAHALTLTNTAQATLGSLELTKKLAGTGAGAVAQDAQFTVTAEWTDLVGKQQRREVSVSAAKPTVIEGIPFGTKVKLTEAVPQSPGGARWASAAWTSEDDRAKVNSDSRSATVVVVGDNAKPVALELENGYTKVDALSVTGADLGGIGAAALVLAGLGGAALMLSRRRARAL